jgi:hypothetical protein
MTHFQFLKGWIERERERILVGASKYFFLFFFFFPFAMTDFSSLGLWILLRDNFLGWQNWFELAYLSRLIDPRGVVDEETDRPLPSPSWGGSEMVEQRSGWLAGFGPAVKAKTEGQ